MLDNSLAAAARRRASHAAVARARGVIPGGVNSPARAFGGVGGEPIFFRHAQGQWLTDLDGNRYLDLIGSWGPMILGHRHPRVVRAIEAALANGTSYGAPTAGLPAATRSSSLRVTTTGTATACWLRRDPPPPRSACPTRLA